MNPLEKNPLLSTNKTFEDSNSATIADRARRASDAATDEHLKNLSKEREEFLSQLIAEIEECLPTYEQICKAIEEASQDPHNTRREVVFNSVFEHCTNETWYEAFNSSEKFQKLHTQLSNEGLIINIDPPVYMDDGADHREHRRIPGTIRISW